MVDSPHDALFRYTFGQPEHAAPLLRALLPPAVAAALDWSTLQLLSGTRIDAGLGRRQTDLLFAVRFRDAADELLVHLLVEHSSRVSRWMVLRLLEYSLGIWRQLVRQQPRRRHLPPICAIVVHHGDERWTAATEFTDLLAPEAQRHEVLRQPRFGYALLSSAASPRPPDDPGLSPLGRLTLDALQNVPRRTAGELRAVFARWGGLVAELLRTPSGEEAFVALSRYVLVTALAPQDVLIELVETEVNKRAGEIMETAGTMLLRQGRSEGRREGRSEGRSEERVRLLTAQLTARFGPLPVAVQERLAAASDEEATRWAIRLLDARALDEVFA